MNGEPSMAEVLSCKSKRQFGTSVDALLAAAEKEREARSYRCKVCRFWHYTSNLKGA